MTMHRHASVIALAALLTMTALGCSAGDADQPSGSGTSDASAASHAWTFDGDLEPVVGNDVTLVANGPLTWSSEAVALDGASSSLVSREPGPVDTTRSFTVTAWVNLRPTGMRGTSAYAAAVSQVGSVAGVFYLGTREGRWDFTMKDADSNDPGHSFTAVGPKAQADPKSWVHLAGAYDADAGEIRLYVNGARVAVEPFNAPWKSEGSLIIGRSQARGTPGDFWPGAVADLRIHEHALADEQLARTVAVGRPRLAPPPAPTFPQAVSQLDGVYVYEMTPAESKRLEEAFGAEAAVAGFPGDASVVQRFAAGLWQQYYLIDGKPYLVNGNPEGDGGTAMVKGDVLTLGNNAGASDYRWKLENGVLSLKLVTPDPDPMVGFVMEHEYKRIKE